MLMGEPSAVSSTMDSLPSSATVTTGWSGFCRSTATAPAIFSPFAEESVTDWTETGRFPLGFTSRQSTAQA